LRAVASGRNKYNILTSGFSGSLAGSYIVSDSLPLKPSTFAKGDFKVIADLKRVYGMNYDVHSSYRFVEGKAPERA